MKKLAFLLYCKVCNKMLPERILTEIGPDIYCMCESICSAIENLPASHYALIDIVMNYLNMMHTDFTDLRDMYDQIVEEDLNEIQERERQEEIDAAIQLELQDDMEEI